MTVSKTDVISKAFQVSYDYLWNYVTNPLMFPVLYPNWISEINLLRFNHYLAKDAAGNSFKVIPCLNKDFGIVDFRVIRQNEKEELHRSRLIPLGDHSTILVHLVVENLEYEATPFNLSAIKDTLESDYENARRIIENVYANQSGHEIKNGSKN